jgi:hypothetical protein
MNSFFRRNEILSIHDTVVNVFDFVTAVVTSDDLGKQLLHKIVYSGYEISLQHHCLESLAAQQFIIKHFLA